MDRKIFMSYAREDVDYVTKFQDELESFLLHAWRDLTHVAYADNIPSKQADAIRGADLVLLFLSDEASRALQNPRSGLFTEMNQIMRWRSDLGRTRDMAVVVIDLEGFDNSEIERIPVIASLAHDHRLSAQASYRTRRRSHVRSVVRDLVSNPLVGGGVQVFPRVLGIRHGAYYDLSWLGSSGGDKVEAISAHSAWEGSELQARAPLSAVNTSVALSIDFSHVGDPNSGWDLAIGFDGQVDGAWLPIDLTRYDAIELEARALPVRATFAFRFADASLDSNNHSYHQTTGWIYADIPPKYTRLKLAIADFDWTKGANDLNTSAVDRTRVLQLVVAQRGDRVSPNQGRLEIRRIRLLLT